MKRMLLLIGVALTLTGCATVEGIGMDISSGARAVESAI
ncbi:entericidin EcnA/B family protein [Pacificitalea manganoxidans]|uniref:Type IV secretion system putative lipoprotein virB7 n=1 Tax=Pacificitalea manganoxidans TaxID=1411902 RepID=A0A291LZW5_9RHOB|nr:lipoprotein [Pacificitalea manganoxidans]ATI42200.1 entericidin EcnA/B family protein [Pacificitalea manganoxidans]MBF53350.1 entericidin EcnA/B family protein [Actibacterium sp.]MDR6307987.1 putative small secreted protein [Pacificitalea manganoxidans]OWU72066.1 entericidin EcnA/B family protein [Roseovarius sp. 22II1-1F6A]|tara:strand:+ start:655 stop:771 length:117 start_codon:yes stop_codon:yes gene_type:complete